MKRTCLLAHNLIRQTLLQAALAAGRSPRQLSFTAALQKTAASWAMLAVCDATMADKLVQTNLHHGVLIGDQLTEWNHALHQTATEAAATLNQPRAQARGELLTGTAA